MNRASTFTLVALGLLGNTLGCEIVAQVDRSRIGDSGGAGGMGGAPTTTSSTTSSSMGGSGGSGGSAPCTPVDDSNPCTTDVCENGVPVHPPTALGTPCSTGGTLCDGKGACVECLSPTDCAGADDACQTRTCVQGTCGHDFAAAGTAVPIQTTGDCKQEVCDGAGATLSQNLDTDVPDDMNPCTDDLCAAGVASNPLKAAGTTCGGALVCDAAGACVGCNAATDCPGVDDECKKRTCVATVCGVAFTAAGTAVAAQTANNCLKATCDGSGNITAVADDTDLPVDDGNPCTGEACSAGAPSHPALANGQVCTDGNACTVADTCQAGVCTGGTLVVCVALDSCHDVGVCDTATGVCSTPNKANGSACSDGNACTQIDTCQAGTCTGANPVTCAALDPCHDAGTCDVTTGACSNPSKADGSACSDSNACTQSETCQAGACTGGVSPCVNGTCTVGPTNYTCACAAGFTGTNCETNIDDCAPNPCLNGGTCTDGVNGFTCQCPPTFTGATCQTPVGPCTPSPCQNGGTCVDGGSTYTCQCVGGFSGTNCTVFSAGDPHGALAPTIADVDADGKPDVLIANAESGSATTPSGSLSVLRGNGDGTLQGEHNYVGAPLSSNAVVAVDVNGDGWLDAITVNGQTNLSAVNGSVSVYLNGGTASPGTFGAPTSFTTGAASSLHLCAADFNGDGAIDVATTSVSNMVSVMFGNGAGGFGAPTLIPIASTGGVQSTIAAADLNGDGKSDLVVTSPSSARVSVLLNQGNGSFAAPVQYANSKSGQTSGLAFGDFDLDGKLDILSNGAAGLYLFFFKGAGDGTFASGIPSSVQGSAVVNSALGVVAGDFSGDGKLDAYVLRTAAAGGIYPLTGAGDGTFSVGALVPTGTSPGLNAIAAGDLDNDGHPDVVVTNNGSATVSVILNSL